MNELITKANSLERVDDICVFFQRDSVTQLDLESL